MPVRDRLFLLQTCISLWGGGVAVACGARLSCSVFMVYSCYCSWHLWRALPYKRCAYGVHTIGGKPAYIESGARSHMAVSIM